MQSLFYKILFFLLFWCIDIKIKFFKNKKILFLYIFEKKTFKKTIFIIIPYIP
jgi:hypothetical protein